LNKLGGASAANNTAVGYAALANQTTGPSNTAIGEAVGANITTGNNTLIGQGVGAAITTAAGNLLIGTSNSMNVFDASTLGAIGIGGNMKPGTNDTCIGQAACHSTTQNSNTTTAIGYQAGLNVTAAAGNVLVGINAGSILTSGGHNTILGGSVASTTLQTGTNNVIIGTSSSCDLGAAIANNIAVCAGSTPVWAVTGGGTPTTASEIFHGGITFPEVTTGTNADFVCMAAGGVLTLQASACTISSLRFKDVLGELSSEQMIADVMALHPLAFKMKSSAESNTDPNYEHPQIGLTAENVASIDTRLAIYEDDMTTPKSYRQEGIIAALVVTAQRQQWEIRVLGIAVVLLMFWCIGLTVAVRRRS
jgi:hypothetical protein